MQRRLGEADRWRLLESAPDAIVIVDHSGRIAFVNSQTEQIFGYSSQELVGQTVEALIPEAARHAHVRHRDAYAAAPHTRAMGATLDLKGQRKNGSKFPVEISLSPLSEGNGQFVISAIPAETLFRLCGCQARRASNATRTAAFHESRL
ncbi:MAG TPA: PAS domain S-box protein [Candidatus Acidoferrales bacterium]|nr:PAS domain S-box protein [Candidatus Acidoferrales bacterium]